MPEYQRENYYSRRHALPKRKHRKIAENEGDYVFELTGNQRCTYEEAKLFLEDHENEKLIE